MQLMHPNSTPQVAYYSLQNTTEVLSACLHPLISLVLDVRLEHVNFSVGSTEASSVPLFPYFPGDQRKE
jgi:hypothetical protein